MSSAFITGASKRIGRALAIKLADLGYDVFIHYSSSEKEARELKKLIESKCSVKVDLVQGDLSKEDELKTVWETVWQKSSSSLEILINNASIFEKDRFLDMSMEDFDNQMDINFIAPLSLMQLFGSNVSKGLIINMLDTRIKKLSEDYFSYTLSKKSLFEATQMAALSLSPQIRVNGIAPGYILSKHSSHESLMRRIPLKQQGSLEDIQKAMVYLIENTFVTGQVLYCDGGEHLSF